MSDVTPAATSRRVLLTTAGAVGAGALLAACGSESPSTPSTPTGASDPSAGAGASTGATPAGGGTVLAKTTDIPVGGGVIFKEEGVVVTQPTEGQFKGFNNICTHMQCPVSAVENGKIKCQCHFSEFAIADGAVLSPPAPRPLEEKKITVENGEIRLA
ncbi:Rieske (2Fe-2S) protein [Catellatospora sp. NPDC049609]|uniref:Rieske (2Fe-2S) protein n=1 Tax=Catellatospora sp. NPDC049609 TaxID=3155505 RepID=UPI00341BCA68